MNTRVCLRKPDVPGICPSMGIVGIVFTSIVVGPCRQARLVRQD
jgi:hypothetical protein